MSRTPDRYLDPVVVQGIDQLLVDALAQRDALLAALEAMWCDDNVRVALAGNPAHVERVVAQVNAALAKAKTR